MRRWEDSTPARCVRSNHDMDWRTPAIQPLLTMDSRVVADKNDNECRRNTPSSTPQGRNTSAIRMFGQDRVPPTCAHDTMIVTISSLRVERKMQRRFIRLEERSSMQEFGHKTILWCRSPETARAGGQLWVRRCKQCRDCGGGVPRSSDDIPRRDRTSAKQPLE